MSWRSALGRAEGHGSAQDGVGHWWTQRLTSVALIVLGCWFVASLLALPVRDYSTVAAWMRSGWTAPALVLFVIVSAWHSQLGVRVVIEDYVHEVGMKTVSLTLVTFAHVIIAAAGAYAVLRVAFGSPL
ncbi:MAG: succinate dehydrogenase, hydrophobic membrane anchor protein [Steroidobacteraceae bacterium]